MKEKNVVTQQKNIEASSEKGNPKVSVIMPMYKCESFASDALDMVCNQTLKEIEIICVLDGPDEALQSIVEERASRDNRVSCIVQEHSNAGTARNTGIDAARGEYLLFLDADDIFDPEMAEKMYSKATETDAEIVMCSYSQTDEWTKATQRGFGFDFSKFAEGKVIDCTSTQALSESIVAAPWNKIFQRKMVLENKLRFSSTRIQNDVFFVTTAMFCAKRLVVIKEDLLTVRRHINADSITSNRAKYSEDSLLVLDELYTWIKSRGLWRSRCKDYYYIALSTLHYQSQFGFNEAFADGMARRLSKDYPWKRMCNTELKQVLDMQFRILKRQKNNIIDEIAVLKNTDNTGREQRLRMIDNKYKVFREIKSLMKKKYGRDLSKRDNPIAWLMWSNRVRGWDVTARKIREKIKGEVLLEPFNVICSGHITTAGHYLTFFIPLETYKEEAIIEELSVAVRCNGYYPIAVSGKDNKTLTPLGPRKAPIINAQSSTRKGEVIRAFTEISSGLGVFVQIRFTEALLKNKEGKLIDNNQSASVQIAGTIRLK